LDHSRKIPLLEQIDRAKECGLHFSGMEAAVLHFNLSEAKKKLAGYWVTREVFILTPEIISCIAFAEANRISAQVSDDFLAKVYNGQLRTIVLIYAAPEQFSPENPAFRVQCSETKIPPSSQKELDTTSIDLWRAGYKTDTRIVTEFIFLDYLVRAFIRARGIDATHLRVWQVNFPIAQIDTSLPLNYEIVDDSGKVTSKAFDWRKLDKSLDAPVKSKRL
jgi:hypothetical protein